MSKDSSGIRQIYTSRPPLPSTVSSECEGVVLEQVEALVGAEGGVHAHLRQTVTGHRAGHSTPGHQILDRLWFNGTNL